MPHARGTGACFNEIQVTLISRLRSSRARRGLNRRNVVHRKEDKAQDGLESHILRCCCGLLIGLILVGIWSARHKGDSNQYLECDCVVADVGLRHGVHRGQLRLARSISMMALGAQYGMLACHF